MWWFRRNILYSVSLLIGLALAGCTLEPLYKSGSETADFLQNVELDVPKDRDSYVLYNRLSERLHSGQGTRYLLSITPRKSEARAGIAADGLRASAVSADTQILTRRRGRRASPISRTRRPPDHHVRLRRRMVAC